MLKIVDFILPANTFKKDFNLRLLAQVNHVYESRVHVGLRNTKTRSEVNRTTKKVYKQKGTGGARHGSRRANLFVGGGIIFGPRPLKRTLNLSKDLKKQALITAFSAKNKDKEVQVVSGLGKLSKTKEAGTFLKGLKAKRFTILLSEKSKEAVRSLANLKNVQVAMFKDANSYQILNGGMILIDEDVFEVKVKAKKEEVKAITKKSAKPVNKSKGIKASI